MTYQILLGDCFDLLRELPPCSVHAACTDPPYAGQEFDVDRIEKMRRGSPGIWRVPTMPGRFQQPIPKSYAQGARARAEHARLYARLGAVLLPVLCPGGHALVATVPALQHAVAAALEAAGFEVRGAFLRAFAGFRGGDRPKGAEREFPGVSVVPRSSYEPWVLVRKPLSEKTAAQNLRRWGTGALRRESDEVPVWDLVPCAKTPAAERRIAPHPCLKPQRFLRRAVRHLLPLGEGTILDPFMGSGSMLAAAEAVGYSSVGMERDAQYAEMAARAIPLLAKIDPAQPGTDREDPDPDSGSLFDGV